MKLLEIRNNLVKLRYDEGEHPVLGRFVTLSAPDRSYVAQIINLKSDAVCSFMIAKLMFTYTPDGIVDSYDGSTPHILSNAAFLPSEELLALLPVETPLKIGNLAQEQAMLSVDISIFEHNFAVLAERDFEKETFISNCIRQLFWMKEKSVVIDTLNIFEDYPKVKLGQDFKIPLNSKIIDFIFDYDLAEVDISTKAVIQEIFNALQQYIETLEDKFLPIDSFIDVVAAQYKETQMPELALLKNKLLKYKEANIFANTKDEFSVLVDKLNERNCTVVDIKNADNKLQCNIIDYIHNILNDFEKYIYLFVPLNNENSDKKLLKKLVANSHIFTTVLASHSYKYVSDLKGHAQNILFFAPQSMQHDFAAYNTFLNKLNFGEGILYGKLTQGIPFIIDISDIALDITRDDVLGDRQQFVPAVTQESDYFSNEDEFFSKNPETEELQNVVEETQEAVEEIPQAEPEYQEVEIPEEYSEPELETEPEIEAEQEVQYETVNYDDVDEVFENVQSTEQEDEVIDYDAQPEEVEVGEENIIAPIENLMEDDDIVDEQEELVEPELLTEDDLDLIEENQEEDEIEPPAEVDLDNIIDDALAQNSNVNMVPIYPAEDELATDDAIDFKQGDRVSHARYGEGVVEKIIKYGNKTLCSISFENVGRRLLDPSVSEFEKI